jgi:hypothetical protein
MQVQNASLAMFLRQGMAWLPAAAAAAFSGKQASAAFSGKQASAAFPFKASTAENRCRMPSR